MITLYIMNNKGFGVLQSLIDNFKSIFIDQVITATDPNVLNDYHNEIVNLCKENGIKVFNRTQEVIINSKYSIAIGWRWLIKKSSSQILVFHDSILPYYRGFAPLVNSLINGEMKIGVTAFKINGIFDSGDIVEQESIKIEYPIKIVEAIEKIIPLYQNLSIKICSRIYKGEKLTFTEQDHSKATYSLWREENDYWINWSKSSSYLKRFIDAVGYPYKGAKTKIEGKEVRILDSIEYPDVKIENRDEGKIIFIDDGFPVIVCGKGLLKILKLVDNENKQIQLPLKKYRIRFGF